MAILTVGTTGQEFTTIADAVAASQDGDVIQVQAGTYTNDFATITTAITIEGVGGMVNLVATQAPPNGKAIFVTDNNITLRNLTFSGAQVPDGNGAGVRYDGSGNLTIDNCIFFDNQDGLLATANPAGSITITNSQFYDNGTGDGGTHNIYINEVGTFTITNSYIHDAIVGHEIKSRADNTIIQGDTIVDGPTGSASYSIDLPDGGNATITDNLIEQGPESQNPAIIHIGGGDGPFYANSSVSISNNVIVNDLQDRNAVAVLNQSPITASFVDNQVYGLTQQQIARGSVSQSSTTFLTAEPQVPCFAEGTRIVTDIGEVPVEHLRVGDRVVVHFGAPLRSVIWLAQRRVDCRRHPNPEYAWPVRISAGAFGPGCPRRDLWLSPEHAIYLCGVMIPVRLLTNGTTIEQVQVDAITYHHVELTQHDVLFAEGLAVESYLDTGNRAGFAGGQVTTLHPEFGWRQWEAAGCAPLVMAGPKLAEARRQINPVSARSVVAKQSPSIVACTA